MYIDSQGNAALIDRPLENTLVDRSPKDVLMDRPAKDKDAPINENILLLIDQ